VQREGVNLRLLAGGAPAGIPHVLVELIGPLVRPLHGAVHAVGASMGGFGPRQEFDRLLPHGACCLSASILAMLAMQDRGTGLRLMT